MTSRIGKTQSHHPLSPSFIKEIFAHGQARLPDRQGFTFIELMVTLAVLSFGIVMIYKAFFASLDQISYLNHRLYATIFLDNQLAEMQRAYQSTKTLPMNFAPSESVEIGYKIIDFKPTKTITAIEDLPQLFQIDLSVSWAEKGNHIITLSRSAYMGDPKVVGKENP